MVDLNGKKTILQEIVRFRQNRLARLGPEQGLSIPIERKSGKPLEFGSPVMMEHFLICEIKRRSPSRGNINNSLDPLSQAEIYLSRGVSHISILTESEYFGGSLEDLISVRKAFPHARILRKDFLLNREDIFVTYRAGADAFLLIASILDGPVLRDLYEYGVSLGMTPLVELHSPEEADKVRGFAPKLTGINCRDLKDFTIDPLGPLKLKSCINWDSQIVYESGIHSPKDARFALGCGFDGLLVGEAVVKEKNLATGLIKEFQERESHRSTFTFWRKLYRNYSPLAPLVKICGITRLEDAREAVRLGANMLGFVLADSPRRIEPARLEEFREIKVPKIGVVVNSDADFLKDLLDRGLLDGFQFHGDEDPELVESFSGYKALTIRQGSDLKKMNDYKPRPVLIDAFHRDRKGNRTELLEPGLIEQARKSGNLWLAGGINPENLAGLLENYSPDLIDMSSGVESAPGVKDKNKLAQIFDIVNRIHPERSEM